MPTCQNCGEHVSRQYMRVFSPEDVDAPAACPNCPDKIREGPGARDKRF